MKPYLSLLPGLLVLLAAGPALAVTDTWDGGGADNNITTALNWLDNTAPASDLVNTDLIFGGIIRLTPNFASTFNARSVTFNNTSGAFVLGGSALVIGTGGIVNNDTNSQTFTNGISIPAGVISTINAASGPLAFGGVISVTPFATVVLDGASAISASNITGAGAVQKNGAGALNWSQVSLIQVDLTINTGTVNLLADGTADTFASNSSIAVNGTSVLSAGENLSLSGASLNLAQGTGLTVAFGKTLTVADDGDLIAAAGLLILPGNVNVTGTGSTISHTQAANTTAISINGPGNVTVSDGGSISSLGTMSLGAGTTANIAVSDPGSNITSGLTVTASTLIGGGSGPASVTFSNSSQGRFGPLGIAIGPFTSNTTVLVESGADVTTTQLNFANSTASATLTVTGPGSSFAVSGGGQVTMGMPSANTATLNVNDEASFNTGTGPVAIESTATVNINGGTFTVNGPLTRNGAINFTSGTLSLLASNNISIGTGGLFPANVTLLSDRTLNVGGTTTIDSGRTLTVNSGTFRTGALVNNGTFDFQNGTVGIMGAGGLTIGTGPLGSSVILGAGSNLQVTNTTTLAANALLRLNGGSFSGGGITNNGTIDYRDGILNFTGTLNNAAGSRLFVGGLLSAPGGISNAGTVTLQAGLGLLAGAGNLTNTGLVTGDGTMARTLINNPGGQLRAEDGKTIAFTAPAASNNGLIALQGGTLSFAFPLTNAAAGVINGHGELYFPATPVPTAASPQAGFNNSGNVNFSGGNTLVFGTSQMAAGSHLIVSGGATATFFDVFRHAGAEVKASAGSALVFFGEVRGPGSFTGTGTIYMEGGFSPGASPVSVSIAPQMVFTESNTLTMEIGGTAAGTEHDKLTFTSAAAPQVTWGGTLAVTFIDGYTPAAGHSFDLFDFDAARDAGTFATLTLPSLPAGLLWDSAQLYTTGVISIVPEGLTFSAWAASVLGNPAATPNGDHDSDGFDNATEFALGLFPSVPNTILPDGTLHPYPDGQRLRLLFTRPLDRTAVTLRVQAGSDLTNWTDLAVSVDSAPFTGAGFVSENRAHPLNEPGLVEIRDILTASTAPRRQMRLLITLSP